MTNREMQDSAKKNINSWHCMGDSQNRGQVMQSKAISAGSPSICSMERREMLQRSSAMALGGFVAAGVGSAGLLAPAVASAGVDHTIEAVANPHIIQGTEVHTRTVPWKRGTKSGAHTLAIWDVAGPSGTKLGRVVKLTAGQAQIFVRCGYDSSGTARIYMYENLTGFISGGKKYLKFHNLFASDTYRRMAFPTESRSLTADIDNDGKSHEWIQNVGLAIPTGYKLHSNNFFYTRDIRMVKIVANSPSTVDQYKVLAMAYFEHSDTSDKRRWRATAWYGNKTAPGRYNELSKLWTEVDTKRKVHIAASTLETAAILTAGVFFWWAMGPSVAAAAPVVVEALEAEGSAAAGATAAGTPTTGGISMTSAIAASIASGAIGSVMGSISNIDGGGAFTEALANFRTFIEVNEASRGWS